MSFIHFRFNRVILLFSSCLVCLVKANAQVVLLPWEPKFDSSYAMNFLSSMVVFDPNSFWFYSTYSTFEDSSKANNREFYIKTINIKSTNNPYSLGPGKCHIVAYREYKKGFLIKEAIYRKYKRRIDTFIVRQYSYDRRKVFFTCNGKMPLSAQPRKTKGYYHYNTMGLMDSFSILSTEAPQATGLFYTLINRGRQRSDSFWVKMNFHFHYDNLQRMDSLTLDWNNATRHFYIDYLTLNRDAYKQLLGTAFSDRKKIFPGFRFYEMPRDTVDSAWIIRLRCADDSILYKRKIFHPWLKDSVSLGLVLRHLVVYFTKSGCNGETGEDLNNIYYSREHEYFQAFYPYRKIDYMNRSVEFTTDGRSISSWYGTLSDYKNTYRLLDYNTSTFKFKTVIKK